MKVYRTTVYLDGEQLGSPIWTTDSEYDMEYLRVVCEAVPDEKRITKTIETFELIETREIKR